MKKRWNRLLLLCCAALLITGLFAGCGAQNKLQKVTVSEVTHSVFYAPQYAAIELGFFEEEGLCFPAASISVLPDQKPVSMFTTRAKRIICRYLPS